MGQKYFYLAVLLIFLSTGCLLDKKKDSEKIKSNISEKYTKYKIDITGFSGICQGKTKDDFLVVSDKKGIYEVDKEGKIIRKLPFKGKYDFEGIAINPKTNEVYLAEESESKVYRLSADEHSIEMITDIGLAGGFVNKGIEGITFGNDTLYIVNQESPALLIKFDLKTARETERIYLNYVQYLSDIYYDNSDKTLWISDSKQKKIFHTDLNGKVLASQSIEFIKKAEALLVDRDSKIVWIGCDETGNLYKVKLEI